MLSKKIKTRIAPSHALDNQWHTFKANDVKFIVDTKYKPRRIKGLGAYGIVISASNTEANTNVAIKKVSSAFTDLVDARRVLREVKLLRHFHHENIIQIIDMIQPKDGPLEDLYIVTNLMDTDLHKVILSKSNTLSQKHMQYFLYQILKGLKYIHSTGVVHRDLKPSNLLVNEYCCLKICDFGLARGLNEINDLTEYVVTRWYRAPEVMCAMEYDKQIDVWGAGCVLAEMIAKKPLFPGTDYISQLELILHVLGTPSDEDMKCVNNDSAFKFIQRQEKKRKIPWKKLYPKMSEDCLDLLDKMLTFNPAKRISVIDALSHPWLSKIATDEDCDPTKGIHTEKFNFEFEEAEITKKNLQTFFWEEIYHYRPHLKSESP